MAPNLFFCWITTSLSFSFFLSRLLNFFISLFFFFIFFFLWLFFCCSLCWCDDYQLSIPFIMVFHFLSLFFLNFLWFSLISFFFFVRNFLVDLICNGHSAYLGYVYTLWHTTFEYSFEASMYRYVNTQIGFN